MTQELIKATSLKMMQPLQLLETEQNDMMAIIIWSYKKGILQGTEDQKKVQQDNDALLPSSLLNKVHIAKEVQSLKQQAEQQQDQEIDITSPTKAIKLHSAPDRTNPNYVKHQKRMQKRSKSKPSRSRRRGNKNG